MSKPSLNFMKAIPGYEGLYCATEDGQVIRVKNGAEKKPRVTARGYFNVSLSKDGTQKTHRLHRLIALTFLGPSDLHVNHKDHDKSNNAVANLEYVTPLQNNRAYRLHLDPTWTPPLPTVPNRRPRRPRAKTGGKRGPKPYAVIAERDGAAVKYETVVQAVACGFDASAISLCLHGKLKKHRGWTFRKAA